MKLSHFVAVLNAAVASASTGSVRRQANFVHPGLLHTEDDFERIRGLVSREPWATGLEKLSARADPDYEPNPQETICRGSNTGCENYVTFYRDVHSAYANAVYWKITGETAHADAAARTLDAWTERAPGVEGNADRFLAAGIYGYQTANAAELLRDYEGWDGVQATADWLASEFYPLSSDFLVNHNDAVDDNYWANVSDAAELGYLALNRQSISLIEGSNLLTSFSGIFATWLPSTPSASSLMTRARSMRRWITSTAALATAVSSTQSGRYMRRKAPASLLGKTRSLAATKDTRS